jgi:hypothetical protein
MYLCFALHEGQAENYLYVFPYDLNTCLTFIVSFSWSFVCVHFHVITWLLSFYCQDYVFHPHVLSSFDPSTQCLLRWSRLCRCISGTNLLTRCHSASSLFSVVFVFQKWYTGNILRIGWNKFLKSYFSRKLPEIRRGEGEGPQASLTLGWRGPGPGRTV